MEIWTPRRERGDIVVAEDGAIAMLGAYKRGRRDKHLFEGRGRLVFPDGTSEWVDDEFRPNVLVDEGEASTINVYLREQANVAKHLMLCSGAAPAETAVMSGLTESATPGAGGYNRQQIAAADWGAPALDAGDMQSSAAEKTFGPNTSAGAWTLSFVALVTVATGTAGLFLVYVATTTTSVGVNVSFKYTLRWKSQ